MPYRPERQYRSFAASNFQPIESPATEVPDGGTDEPSYRVRGYWTTFSSEYELYPRIGDWPAEYEQIDPHALDGADMSDVIFQLNHEGSPLARQRNDSLTLGIDDHGAWCEAYLGGSQRGRDTYEEIANGLIVEMSFGFMIADDEDGQGTTFTRDEQGDYHTTITRISKVFDVSCVSIPANDGTEIHARSAIKAQIEADRKAEQDAPEAIEQRSADEVSEQPMAETEEFDIDSIVDQVMERMAQRQQPEQQPEQAPEHEPEVTNDEAEQALEDAERGTQAERRRRRRMRALQLISI